MTFANPRRDEKLSVPIWGVLPAGWKVLPFGDLLEPQGIRNGIYKSKEFHGHGAKIVNMGELFAFPRLGNVPMKRIEVTSLELSRFSLETGDLLFARRSLIAEGAGKCSVVLDVKEPTVFESSIIRARPDKNKANSIFLYYLFKSEYGAYVLDTIRRQVAVSGITGADLLKLKLPVPPLATQNKIADVLSLLDDKIDLNRKMNETLEQIARTIFKSWFIDFDPVRAKAEGKKPFGMDDATAALFPDGFEQSELGEIPRGWRVGRIEELANIVGGSTPSTKETRFWADGIHNWATPKDLSALTVPVLLNTERRLTDAGLAQIGSGLLPIGTVLLSSRAPIGYVAITEIPVAINQGFIAMMPKLKVSSVFLLLWTKAAHREIVSRANGSTFLEISKTNFRPISLVIPPNYLMVAFDHACRPLYDKIVQNERESRLLNTLRDLLLPHLLSGELSIGNKNE